MVVVVVVVVVGVVAEVAVWAGLESVVRGFEFCQMVFAEMAVAAGIFVDFASWPL